MIDTKKDFKTWLITNKKYKPSSANCFVGSIDSIYKDFFCECSNHAWNFVIDNIIPILTFYTECSKKECFLSISSLNNLLNHYKTDVIPYLQNVHKSKKNIFPQIKITFIVEEKEKLNFTVSLDQAVNYLEKIQFIVEQYQANINYLKTQEFQTLLRIKFGTISEEINQFIDLILENDISSIYINLKYQEKNSKQFKNALVLLYEFLIAFQYPISKYKNIPNFSNPFYNDDCIYKLQSKINWGSGMLPPQIDASSDVEAYPKTVIDILRISERQLKRFSEKILIPLDNGNYSVSDVNKFIRDRFVPSRCTTDFTYKDKWWTAKEAHEKTGIHRKQIQRIRNDNPTINCVAHIKISTQFYLFYPPDIRKFSKNK